MNCCKIRNFLIKNKELLLGLIVGLILSSTAVYGVIKYASSNVFYRNTDSHLSATTVQSAIDELYTTCTSRAYTLTADSKGGVIPTTSGWNVNGSTATKTVIFNGTYGTLPTPTKNGYSFDGWYTKESGGTQITSSSIYRYSQDSTIHAHWNTNSYTIAYTMNGGNNPSPKPTSGITDETVSIGTTTAPTKTVTVTGNANSTGATVGAATSGTQTFAGWTSSSSTGLGSNAKTGTSTSPTTAWTGSATTNKYFKNLRDTSGTVTLTATWTPVAFNLPTVTKAGWTCKWNTKADGSGTSYNSGASYTPTANSDQNITMYAKCTGNTYTGTFYYQSNTTSGSTTVSSKTAQCTVTSGNSCSVTIPSEVTASGGTYNNKYAGLSTSTGNMTQAVAGSATTVTLSANTSYYSLYRTTINIYYPTSTTVTASKATYQNQWFTSNTAMSTTVLSSSTTGTSSNATAGTLVSGYGTLIGFNTATSTNTQNKGATIAALAQSDSGRAATVNVYQVAKGTATKTATFYYNNNTTCGGTTVASTTASGTQTTFLRPTSTTAAGTSVSNAAITVPSAVTGSKGPYNATYINVASAVNSMTAATVNTGTLTYYAFYRSNVTRYYPSSTTATTSDTLYRNEVFTSTTAMKTVLSTTNTGTSTNAAARVAVSGYGTLVGFNTAASQNSANSGATIAALATTCNTTVYEIDKGTASKTATFYYNNNTTCGGTTVASTTASGTQTTFLRPTSTTAAGTSVSNGAITVPTAVTGSKGPYNATYINVASAVNSMTAATVNTGTLTYYAFYRSNVTRYYPSSTTATTSDTLYRNEVFTSTTAMKTVLATTNTGTTTNAAAKLAVSGYGTLVGFNTAASQNSANSGATIAALATTCNTTVYEIDKGTASKTATFYYQSSATNGTCSVTSTTASGTQTTFLRPTSTTASGTSVSNGSITVPTAVSESVGQYNNAYAGVASAVNSMSAATVNTGTLTYYAFYRTNVTNYYWNSSSYASRTLYRTMTLSSTTACRATNLTTSTTGTSNYSTAVGPGNSAWAGLSTGNDTTAEYTSVAAAAASNSTTLYTVYQHNVTYSKGVNISSIGATSGSCKLVSSATSGATTPNSCNVTLPTITPNSGYTSVGWGTSSGATSGTAAGSSKSITSTTTTLYANAYPTISYNAGSTCTGATGMPTSQIKLPSVNLTLQSGEPTCSGKVFLGWSTTSSATASSTWYDGGTTYSTDSTLTLYAQFYDVNSLENAYTSYVQGGDFSHKTTTGGTAKKDEVSVYMINEAYPTQTGYSVKSISGYYDASPARYRVFGIDNVDMKIKDLSGDAAPSNLSDFKRDYFSVKTRSSVSYNDNIDTRIDRLQKLQDVVLTYDDIKTVASIHDNLTIPKNGKIDVCFYKTDLASNWELVSPGGYNVANASTNGGFTSRVAVFRYMRDSSCTNTAAYKVGLQSYASPSTDPKVKLTLYYIVARNDKKARTTTFAPTSSKGFERYKALTALNSDKGNHFPQSYIKRYTRVEGSTGSISAWGTGTATKNFSIPDGKILGVVGHGVNIDSGGFGSSYSIINKNWVEGMNGTTGTFHLLFYAGNNESGSSTGNAQTKVFGWGHPIYVSSGTLTIN